MTTRRTKRVARSLGLALGLAGGLVAASGEGAEVVVYSARGHYGQEPAMEAFTKKTGIQIKSFGGEAGPLFERLKAEGDKTPADVLISVDAGNLWNAARAGLLSKVDSPEIQTNIPGHLRDPEGRWIGLTVRARTIMYNTQKVKPEELSTYEALGDPKSDGPSSATISASPTRRHRPSTAGVAAGPNRLLTWSRTSRSTSWASAPRD